jgi:putative membrane protein
MIVLSCGNTDRPWQYGWDDGGGSWWLWGPLAVLFWVAVTAAVVWLVLRHNRRNQPSPLDRARTILAERYARGEIDNEEYERRVDHLR